MSRKQQISLWLAASALLMVVALFNGFPLVESDTGAYIEAGILNQIPKDRSPFYGWFIRYTSMWSSLWYTILAQCMLTAYLLLRLLHLLAGRLPLRWAYIAVILTTAFTCLPWVTAYLMPDIFAGILLMACLLFLTDTHSGRGYTISYAVIILLATVIHNAHAPQLFLFSACILLLGLLRTYRALLLRATIMLLLSVASWALVCWSNAANGYGFTFSRGSHVFMVTKLAETGILSQYLAENCERKQLRICQYQNDIPDYSWDFMWSEQSALYKSGGWDSTRHDFDIIIHDVFTTPRYLGMYARKCVTGTLRQLTQIQPPERTSYQGEWSSPWQRVRTFYEDEFGEYRLSAQYNGGMSGTAASYFYTIYLLLSTLLVILLRRQLHPLTTTIYILLALFFITNAFVTSMGSTVIYRFQYRIVWLLPCANTLLLLRYIINRSVAPHSSKKETAVG